MNVALQIVMLAIEAGVLLAPIYLLVKLSRWGRAISRSASRAPWGVRIVEVGALAGLAEILIAYIATGGIGLSSSTLPPGLVQERLRVCGIAAIVTIAWLIVGLSRSMVIGAAGLILCGLFGTFFLHSSKAMSYESYQDEIRQIPLPVSISLVQPVADVDVLINGVRMGTAPLQTTVGQIETEAPPIPFDDKDEHKFWKNFGSSTYVPRKKLEIDRGNRVVIATGQQDRETLDLVLQLERHGEPVYISGSMSWQSGSRMFGQIQPARIALSVMTETWYQDVTTLLQRARMLNYQIDADWVAAADTYFEFVREAIQQAIPNEPAFEQVLKDWARFRYHLDEVTTSDAAWNVLETIQHQADEEGAYSTNSIAGDAIDQLVDLLDADRVISFALRRLSSYSLRNSPGYGWSWGRVAGKHIFGTAPGTSVAMVKSSDFVLAQVVWRLDQKWDTVANPADNQVAQKIVPRLMQFGYYSDSIKTLALNLGGPVVDQFEQRKSQEILRPDATPDIMDQEFVGGRQVSRSAWRLLNLDNEIGAQYRRQYYQSALRLAQDFLRDQRLHSPQLPEWMPFLFLNVEDHESLARGFWNDFHNTLVTDKSIEHYWMNLEWAYLSRIRPLPAASEFIDAYPGDGRGPGIFFNAEQSLSSLPVEMQFEIASACLKKAEHDRSIMAVGSPGEQQNLQAAHLLRRMIATIPVNGAVDETLDIIAQGPSNPQAAELAGTVQAQAATARLSSQMMSRLIRSSDAEHRKWVLPQIQARPIPANRQLLDGLLKDESESVRTAAQTVARELDELSRKPLPKLQ